MTPAIAGLCVALGGLMGTMLVRIRIVELLLRNRDVDHAKCISHVAHYTGNEFASMVLKAAAEDYASAEGQHQLKVIVQSGQSRAIDAPPIPAIWMENRATELLNEVRA